MSRRFTALIVVLFVVGSASLLAAPAGRQTDQPTVAAAAGEESAFVVDRAIVRDEKSSGWRKPTREETVDLVRTLKQLTRRSSESLAVTTAADGTQMADLGGGFNQVMLARPDAEGGTEILCVSTFEEAAEFLGLRYAPIVDPKAQGGQR